MLILLRNTTLQEHTVLGAEFLLVNENLDRTLDYLKSNEFIQEILSIVKLWLGKVHLD